MADSGDGLDDANFDENVANSAILRLYVFEKWIHDELKKAVPPTGLNFAEHFYETYDLWDKIFDNQINLAIE